MDASTWEGPDPGELRVLGSPADWDALAREYGDRLADRGEPAHMGPFRRCLQVAQEGGALSLVIETRYVDLDYRSEYSSFYSRGFLTPPNTAHRLHFFRAPLRVEQLADLPEDAGYVGYMIVRPAPLGPVGRTMIAPPPGMENSVRTSVYETVTLFGQKLSVKAVPFMQQDAQLDRCAHAAAWSCHYAAFRRGEVSRRPVASFSLMADASLGIGRPIPSDGLTPRQLADLLRLFDLPCQYYDVETLPGVAPGPGVPPDPAPAFDGNGQRLPAGRWDTRIISICCRYLNSAVPVIVGTDEHAFVLCGYSRQARGGASNWIRFVRHDDQRGPYLWVDDIRTDKADDGYEYAPWRLILVPLPEKLWLPPERAEGAAAALLDGFARRAASLFAGPRTLVDLQAKGQLALRTYARPANTFKAEAAGRIDPILLPEYRLARFSRFVWVVEAVDRARRDAGNPNCVVGEAVFDATSSGFRPTLLALHIPGVAVVYDTKGAPRGPILCSSDPYRTGGVGAA